MSMDAESRRMIGNELRINYTCRSPFLVRCFEAFLEDGRVSIVLEYMDAGSLADVLRSVGRLTEPYLASISRQVRGQGQGAGAGSAGCSPITSRCSPLSPTHPHAFHCLPPPHPCRPSRA